MHAVYLEELNHFVATGCTLGEGGTCGQELAEPENRTPGHNSPSSSTVGFGHGAGIGTLLVLVAVLWSRAARFGWSWSRDRKGRLRLQLSVLKKRNYQNFEHNVK